MHASKPFIHLRPFWVVCFILILAFAVRVGGIHNFPVWTDEGWSTWASSGDLTSTLQAVAEDRHPPLYFVALNLWRGVAGDSHIATRLLSVMGGMLTLVFVYRLTADHFPRKAAVWATILASSLAILVYYSQEVRHYGWLTLFAIASWWALLRLLKHRHNKVIWVVYTVSLALMMYTQYFGLFVAITQAVVVIFFSRLRWREQARVYSAWAVAVMLYLPWLWVIATVQWELLQTGIAGFPGTLRVMPENLLAIAQLLFGEQLAVSLSVFLFGTVFLLAQHRSVRHLQVWIAGGGFLLLMLTLGIQFDILSARTLVFITPMLCVICGVGLAQVSHGGLFAVAFAVISLAAPQVIQVRLPLHQVMDIVAPQYSQGDWVVLETGWDDNAFAYEIGLALPEGASILRTLPWTNDRTGGEPIIPAIQVDLATYQRVWVIQWLQAPQVSTYLHSEASGFRPVIFHTVDAGIVGETFGDAEIDITLFERLSIEPLATFGESIVLGSAVYDEPTSQHPFHVDLWWLTRAPLALDYSIGVFLLDETGTAISEQNSAPTTPTSQWTVDTPYFDRHTLNIPASLPAGTYQLAVRVYWYAEPENPLPVQGEHQFIIDTFTLN